jgi:cytochrome c oxidase subunit 3
MKTISYPMENKKNVFNEKTFIVWLLIVASSMLFLAFGSAYWVHKTDSVNNGAWTYYHMPVQFWISTAIVLISGITMQLAYNSARKDNVNKIPALITLTFLLGVSFFISQIMAYQALIDMGYFLSNNKPGDISVTFLYVISGVHLLHIVGGLVLLIVGIVKASKLEVHKKNLNFIKICTTYWHFLGIVWILLILFLYFA